MSVSILSRKKLITIIGLSFALLLQYQLWFNKNGILSTYRLYQLTLIQQKALHRLQRGNTILLQHIKSLKNNPAFLEEKARSELDMIKSGETLYRFSDEKHDQ